MNRMIKINSEELEKSFNEYLKNGLPSDQEYTKFAAKYSHPTIKGAAVLFYNGFYKDRELIIEKLLEEKATVEQWFLYSSKTIGENYHRGALNMIYKILKRLGYEEEQWQAEETETENTTENETSQLKSDTTQKDVGL